MASTDEPQKVGGTGGNGRLIIGLVLGLVVGSSIFYFGVIPNPEVINLRDELTVVNLQLEEAQLNISELNELVQKTRSDLIEAQQDLVATRGQLDVLLTEPRISLIEVVVGDVVIGGPFVGFQEGPCFGPAPIIGVEFKPDNRGASITIGFTLINTGSVEGFATVEMVARDEVLGTSRFFLDSRTRQDQTMSADNLICGTDNNEVSIRIASVEPA